MKPVQFRHPNAPTFLPSRARIPIEDAFGEAQVKLANNRKPHDHFICELLQQWADALLGIYLMSAGLQKASQLEPPAVTRDVSSQILVLIAEYKLLPSHSLTVDWLDELLIHRTRYWLRGLAAEEYGTSVADLEFVIKELPRLGSEIAAASPARPREAPLDAKKKGRGRPPGRRLDGLVVKEHRGERTQAIFAEKCDVSTDTIQRAESGHPLSSKNVNKIRTFMSTEKTERKVDGLEKPHK